MAPPLPGEGAHDRPRLESVRAHGRSGAAAVAAVGAAFVAIVGLATLSAPPRDPIRPPSPEAAGGTATPESISLVEVRRRARLDAERPEVFSAFVVTTAEAARAPFRAVALSTPEAATACSGDASFTAPTATIGLVTEDLPVTDYALERLAAGGERLKVAVLTLEQAADGFVVQTLDGAPFPAGAYVLTLRAHGAIELVSICLG